MKYRLTPFHGFALLTTIFLISEIIEVSKIKGDPGLGGLGPYIMFGLTAAILLIDIFIQAIIKSHKWVIIIEIVLIIAAAIYYYIEVP